METFPGGKMKAITFSYDDGIIQDIRLSDIFRKYGMKCTFNLNSGIMSPDSQWQCNGKPTRRLDKSEMKDIYTGHEIAMHFLTHPYPQTLSDEALDREIGEDVKNLEAMFGQKIIGSAYPYGQFDDRIVSALKKHGIQYARTVIDTHSFDLQTNLLEFNPTCHHNDPKLMDMARYFVSIRPEHPMLFYVWGHSYEFDGYNNWDIIERFCDYVAGKEEIYYGTNSEVFGL